MIRRGAHSWWTPPKDCGYDPRFHTRNPRVRLWDEATKFDRAVEIEPQPLDYAYADAWLTDNLDKLRED